MVYQQRSFLLALLAAVLMTVAPSLCEDGSRAEARVAKKAQTGAKNGKKSQEKAGKKAQEKAGKKAGKKGKRRGKSGHNAPKSSLRTAELDRPSGNLWVFSENMHEEVKVNIYDEDGNFDDEALAKLDHEFRCRRTGEERAVDPRLYEMLSRIQDHFEGRRILLVSGFRFQRNEGSRHYHASAMDIRIPGVSIRKIRAYAESLDRGGMGIGLYPNANFVHVDFRAPGQPSYRWIDRSRPGQGNSRGKRRSRRAQRRENNS